MAQIILGPHNGVRIKGTRPRRPKTRRIKPPSDSSNDHERSHIPHDGLQPAACPESVSTPPPAPSVADAQVIPFESPAYHWPQMLDLVSNDQWHIERQPDNTISISLHSVHDLRAFLQTLGELAFHSTLHSPVPSDALDDSKASRGAVVRRRRVLHPYIKYHSELYAESAWPTITSGSGHGADEQQPLQQPQPQQQPQQQQQQQQQAGQSGAEQIEWPALYSTLSTIIDDCIHYFVECMNHYYPVRPRRVVLDWYSKLENPQEDAFALAIGTFWCRHLLIHHRPASLQIEDSRVLDMIQHRLACMTRDAVGDHFDQPDVERIFALCLCNMTTVFSMEQKAMFHTIAVRMATALDIRPRTIDDSDTGASTELHNRLWWYLYQIDHFLHESGAIQKSMLSPHSDDHDALSRLVRPTPCSLDEPDEVAGALEWGHVLELWILRRRIVKDIEATLDRGDLLTEHMYDSVKATLISWKARTPETIRGNDAGSSSITHPDQQLGTPCSISSNSGSGSGNGSGSLSMTALEESRLAINMEFCTNMCLILHHFCPHQDTTPITPLERQAVLDMIEYSTEMLRLRRAVVSFAPCQTWPGDLKRSIEILMYCTKYGDDLITGRAKHGLVHARHVLRNMAEVKWKDPICMVMISDIEHVLYASPSPSDTSMPAPSCTASNYGVQDDRHTTAAPPARAAPRAAGDDCDDDDDDDDDATVRRRSIKMANNMYTGMMMFDRELQPRAQYYRPADTSDPLDNITVFEDVSRYMH